MSRFETYLRVIASSAAVASFGGCGEGREEQFREDCRVEHTLNAKRQLLEIDLSSDIAETGRSQERFEKVCEELWPLRSLADDRGPLDLENPTYSKLNHELSQETLDYIAAPYRHALREIQRERVVITESGFTEWLTELNNDRALIIGAVSDVQALEDIAEEYGYED